MTDHSVIEPKEKLTVGSVVVGWAGFFAHAGNSTGYSAWAKKTAHPTRNLVRE